MKAITLVSLVFLLSIVGASGDPVGWRRRRQLTINKPVYGVPEQTIFTNNNGQRFLFNNNGFGGGQIISSWPNGGGSVVNMPVYPGQVNNNVFSNGGSGIVNMPVYGNSGGGGSVINSPVYGNPSGIINKPVYVGMPGTSVINNQVFPNGVPPGTIINNPVGPWSSQIQTFNTPQNGQNIVTVDNGQIPASTITQPAVPPSVATADNGSPAGNGLPPANGSPAGNGSPSDLSASGPKKEAPPELKP